MSGHLPHSDFWRGRRVLLTGHTGFKGSWAALWLAGMGAEVTGLALPPPCTPSLYELANVEGDVRSEFLDLRDREAVRRTVEKSRPEIVLHMAAQPLVGESLHDPIGTISANVLGTAHLLDALRGAKGLRAVLVVTSDKVYANAERGAPFVEGDPLGGKDPYSASKAATELVAASFARSFFDRSGIRLATARGGNVIGGGDFAAGRLVPDVVRAVVEDGPLVLRHPEAIRPWQHVLDCLAGYLLFAEALVTRDDVPPALNFGPGSQTSTTVGELAEAMQSALGAAHAWRHQPVPDSVETATLTLDAAQARERLGWREMLPGQVAIQATARWYRRWLDGDDMRAVTLDEIASCAAGRVLA